MAWEFWEPSLLLFTDGQQLVMAWTSFICLTGIGLTIGVNQMIAAGFNATIMAMIFVFLLMAVLDETGTVTWMVNSILGGKFTKGKPWLTLILLFAACYIGGVLNSMVMAIVFVGVFTTICTNLGVKPFTKLPTFLMIGAALSLLMGQIGVPVMGNALMLVATYNAMFPEPLNFAKYMLFMIPMGISHYRFLCWFNAICIPCRCHASEKF